MPDDVQVRFETAKFERALTRFPNDLFREMRTEYGFIMKGFLATFTKERLNAMGPTDEGVHTRTGDLKRSFSDEVVGTKLGDLTGIAFSTSVYAPVHEFSHKVRPKRAKYLAIPLRAAKTKAGVARGSPRDFPDTKLVPFRRNGKLHFLVVQEKGQQTVPLFLLTKGPVDIPARLGFIELWSSPKNVNFVVGRMNMAIERALAKAEKD